MTHVRTTPLDLDTALAAVRDEIDTAAAKWPAYNSAHEGYAVLLEEVHELFEHVRQRQSQRDIALMRTEAIQVACVALRFAIDVCTEERGRR